jgi:hypothetical protein
LYLYHLHDRRIIGAISRKIALSDEAAPSEGMKFREERSTLKIYRQATHFGELWEAFDIIVKKFVLLVKRSVVKSHLEKSKQDGSFGRST